MDPTRGALVQVRWRVGRKLGRTVYAVVGSEASDDDILIGMMDTDEIAAEVVNAHNRRFAVET